MKEKLVKRCLFGAIFGVAGSFIISILISVVKGDGVFYAVVPALVEDYGNEVNAVVLQTICSFVYGAAWAGATVIWEMEGWSILRQTLTHMVICSVATFPIAYVTRWMSHDWKGILVYVGIFFGVYLIIWLSQYSNMKRRVQQFNEKLQENNIEK